MTDTRYRPRVADGLVAAALRRAGAVQIVGPKWCGKTTTAEQFASQSVFFQDPDNRVTYRRIAEQQPSLLLRGDRPLLLDEWQDAPQVWDAVRFAVDREGEMGQFILTGSAVPNDQAIAHSGTGRFARVVMRPMSLFESGDSSGQVSLSAVAEGGDLRGASEATLQQLAALIVRGGWPASVTHDDEEGAARASDYVESVINSDVSRVDGVEKNPHRVRQLMRSLARNEATEAAMTTIHADTVADGSALSVNTIAQYMEALRRIYVLDEQPAWPLAVRSKTAIRTTPTRRLCDPSLSAVLLGLTASKMLTEFSTFGLLFESLCVRDLRIYADAMGAAVYRYRDARGLEADAVVEFPDGRWGAVQIKLQSIHEDDAAASLLSISRLVRSQHGGEASFLMVITASGIARRRPDGVCIVPIGCLKP